VTLASLSDWLLFGHVVAAVVWLGGGVMLAATAVATVRGANHAALTRFVRSLSVVGPAVLAPAAVLTPVLGVWLTLDEATWDFDQTWIRAAVGLVVAAVAVGIGHQSRVTLNAQRAIERDDPAEGRRQLVRWAWGYAVVVAAGRDRLGHGLQARPVRGVTA
jgi:uncharacterized membrane protein